MDNNKTSQHFSYKLIVIGDVGIGKTSLTLRYTDKSFKDNSAYTIGVDYRSVNILIDEIRVKLNIFDTAGQQTYRSVVRTYYNQVDAVIFAYSIANKKSFEDVDVWLQDYANNCDNTAAIKILVGTKCDLEKERQIPTEVAKEFVERNHFLFSFQTSAKENTHVDLVFEEIARNLLVGSFKQKKSTQENSKKDLVEMLKNPEESQSSNCC